MRLFVMSLCVWILICCSTPRSPDEQPLDEAFDVSRIDRVEIFTMRPRTETPVRMSPEMLERNFACKLEIRHARLGISIPQRVLYATFLRKGGPDPDVRTGVVFFDTEGHRLASVYFDQAGRAAAHDGAPVRVRGPLYSWVEGALTCP
jgi:hypothetical protein